MTNERESLTDQRILEIADENDYADEDPKCIVRLCRAIEREVLGAHAGAPAVDFVRYCPGCGSTGPVDPKYRDCCPDGSLAFSVPKAFAEQCHGTFTLALRALAAPAVQAQSTHDAAVRARALEEAAELLDRMNESSGDAAAYDNRDMYPDELEREHAFSACAKAIRELAGKEAAATEARAEALEQEVEQLKQRLEKKHKSHFITSQALHNVLVGNQSAWIEWQHGAGAEAAMTWIHNGLAGPGLIPDGKEAQPWFDEHQDDRYDIPPMIAAKQSAQGETGGDDE